MELMNPLNLNIIDATGYTTGGNWDFYDQAHIDEIADSMRRNGWQGAPLVVLPDYAVSYSGTHRLRAAEAAELDEVPAVTLHDLFEACDLDLNAICDEHDFGFVSNREEIVAHLPEDVRVAYTLNDIE
ncbi:ParB/Srx family N-terminal domain-containing protein [Streptomyces sp. NPDC047987]|uniref:ParB/Srx family N-terminal domain-containing protein n=1 Tax=unclassified Streptomyces TaxID=2593676 RepID=UPI003414E00F